MTGEGAGMAAGIAVGVALAEEERKEAESRSRRRSHMGTDQVMLETKKGIGIIGKEIAGIYPDCYYNEGEEKIYRNSRGVFSFLFAVIGSIIAGVSLFVYFVLVDMAICTMLWDDACKAAWYPLDFFSGVIFCLTFGILAGFVLHPVDEPLDPVRLSSSKKGTRVLLKIYDEDGIRNFDEDEIADIKEMM